METLPSSRSVIEHRPIKVKHPWINGPVERMNRTTKNATVKQFAYGEFICKQWTAKPERFMLNPFHQMSGLTS